MVTLIRTVRFAVEDGAGAGDRNGYAGRPAMRGLGRHYEVDVTCAGEPDAKTKYLVDIREVDRAVLERALPILRRAVRDAPESEPGEWMGAVVGALRAALGERLRAVRWRLTPYYGVEMAARDSEQGAGSVVMRQRFEFSASHRLHSPALTDDENRRLYGKCNNPAGHGHNYVVEPAVRVRLRAGGSKAGSRPTQPFTLADLERVTAREIIDRLDHKHLNEDVREFAGVIPSVEEIARVCYTLLAPAIEAGSPDARLESVTVHETEKTSATYPG